jgi:hypothetical protein
VGEGREQKECGGEDRKERTSEWRRKKDDNALKRWIWGW